MSDFDLECSGPEALFGVTPAAVEARATVIMFLGNAAQNWQEFHPAEKFYKMRCNVLLASYRGYGFSTGSPSLQIDAQTALDYVLNEPYPSQTPIVGQSSIIRHKELTTQILRGHSLGGAVAIDLASRNPSKWYIHVSPRCCALLALRTHARPAVHTQMAVGGEATLDGHNDADIDVE
ncbi:hypothetical protein DXG01_001371 [Tephrocybe rancida]|nr:hypothetical protein DXG01_001371 [Tephrocybe rancida]